MEKSDNVNPTSKPLKSLLSWAQNRLTNLARLAMAGADDTVTPDNEPHVILWRRFRDGRETHEALPGWLAEWTLAAIPECEPDVERARIVTVKDTNCY